MIDLALLLNVEDAASLLGCKPDTLRTLLLRGGLPAVKFGVDWILPTAALLERINVMAVEQASQRASEKPKTRPVEVSLVNNRKGRKLPDLAQLSQAMNLRLA